MILQAKTLIYAYKTVFTTHLKSIGILPLPLPKNLTLPIYGQSIFWKNVQANFWPEYMKAFTEQ